MTPNTQLQAEPGGATDADVDPITFEVVRNAFMAVCNEMSLVLMKTAYSTPVNEGHDFSSCVYDAGGQLVAQGDEDLPAFIGLTMLTVPEVIREIGIDQMRDGDIFMINDPYVASTHCNDVHLVKPVFVDGELTGFVTSTAHWSDVGGVAPGSLNCRARTHFEEGVRIPAIRIWRDGEMAEDVMKVLMVNMRQPWERMGDFHAQVASVHTGESRLQALCARYGRATVTACMSEAQSYTERLFRSHISDLPDGVYEAADRVDQDIWTGEPKHIRLRLTVAGDSLVVDLTGSDGPAESGINCTIAATTSATAIAMSSILPPAPMNAGVMRVVDLQVKRGSLLWAEPPSAVSGLAATSMECVIACIMQALSQAAPARGAGSPYSILNSVYSGFDERPGFQSPFINYAWGMGGLGGTLRKDGPSAVASAYSASTTNIPCELQERRYPVLYWRYRLRQDSGGPGTSRGGLGLDQELAFPDVPATISCIGNRERFGPPGVFGGEPGRTAHLTFNYETDRERNIGIFCVNEPSDDTDRLSYWSAGGGGYGDPLSRSVERVVEDLLDEYISVESAERDYGVVVSRLDLRELVCEIDEEATQKLRDRRMSETASEGGRAA